MKNMEESFSVLSVSSVESADLTHPALNKRENHFSKRTQKTALALPETQICRKKRTHTKPALTAKGLRRNGPCRTDLPEADIAILNSPFAIPHPQPLFETPVFRISHSPFQIRHSPFLFTLHELRFPPPLTPDNRKRIARQAAIALDPSIPSPSSLAGASSSDQRSHP